MLDHLECIADLGRFDFSRLCYLLTNAKSVDIERGLVEAICKKFKSHLGSAADDYNDKDINNILGLFSANHIKRVMTETEQDDLWSAILDDLTESGRLDQTSSTSLVILSKLVASSGRSHSGFWEKMASLFTQKELKLSFLNFLTISNAFKVAHTIDDMVFVEQALIKLSDASKVNWKIVSLLISTLNLVSDETVAESAACAELWHVTADRVSGLLESGEDPNLHTLLMTVRNLEKQGLTQETCPHLWKGVN